MTEDPYVYPGTTVLRNRFGITDAATLDYHERELVRQRASEGVPGGDFDLQHLQSIHRHLFQDVYDWAGQLRTVEISKGGHQFQFRQYIETGMADVHRRLVRADFHRGTSRAVFAQDAGRIIGDVNYVHPFREGNGRTQLLYLKPLAFRAGHRLDLRKIERESWMEASRRANNTEYDPMSRCIEAALDRGRGRDQSQAKSRDSSRDKGRER